MRYIASKSGATICKCTILFSLFFDVSIQKKLGRGSESRPFFFSLHQFVIVGKKLSRCCRS